MSRRRRARRQSFSKPATSSAAPVRTTITRRELEGLTAGRGFATTDANRIVGKNLVLNLGRGGLLASILSCAGRFLGTLRLTLRIMLHGSSRRSEGSDTTRNARLYFALIRRRKSRRSEEHTS